MGQRALEHIDAVLRSKPDKDDHALSHATMCLSAFRNQIVAEWREQGLSAARYKQLQHVNAVITIVLAIHFPLGEVPWAELQHARDWLADILQGEAVA